MILGVALILALVALVTVLGIFFRVSKNVGPLSLEDYARRNNVVFLPVEKTLVESLQTWSKPVRIRIDAHTHPLLGELICTSELEGPDGRTA